MANKLTQTPQVQPIERYLVFAYPSGGIGDLVHASYDLEGAKAVARNWAEDSDFVHIFDVINGDLVWEKDGTMLVADNEGDKE